MHLVPLPNQREKYINVMHVCLDINQAYSGSRLNQNEKPMNVRRQSSKTGGTTNIKNVFRFSILIEKQQLINVKFEQV